MNRPKTRTALLLAFCLVTSAVYSQAADVAAAEVGDVTVGGDVALAGDGALVGARIYPSPTAAPIENGTVLIRNGKITGVGSTGKIVVPKSFRIIDCKGMTLTAAYWNCHVHFIEPKWNRADTMAAKRFDEQMADMLSSHGFSYAFDLAEFD